MPMNGLSLIQSFSIQEQDQVPQGDFPCVILDICRDGNCLGLKAFLHAGENGGRLFIVICKKGEYHLLLQHMPFKRKARFQVPSSP